MELKLLTYEARKRNYCDSCVFQSHANEGCDNVKESTKWYIGKSASFECPSYSFFDLRAPLALYNEYGHAIGASMQQIAERFAYINSKLRLRRH